MCYRVIVHHCKCSCYSKMPDPKNNENFWVNPYAAPIPCKCPQRTDFPRYLMCSTHSCCILTGRRYECILGDCTHPTIYHRYVRSGTQVDKVTGEDEYGMIWDNNLDKITLDIPLIYNMERLNKAPSFEQSEFLLARDSFCKLSDKVNRLQTKQCSIACRILELKKDRIWRIRQYRRLREHNNYVHRRIESDRSEEEEEEQEKEYSDVGFKQLAYQLGSRCKAARNGIEKLEVELVWMWKRLTAAQNEMAGLEAQWRKMAHVLKDLERKGLGRVDWGVRKPWHGFQDLKLHGF